MDENRDKSIVRTVVDDLSVAMSKEIRERLLERLYCELHNTGYQIEGNTEASDVEWFARQMYQSLKIGTVNWGMETSETKEQWIRDARNVLSLFPQLMSRISHRAITHARAVKGLLEGERALRQARKKGD